MKLEDELREIRATDADDAAGAKRLHALLGRKDGVIVGAAADRIRLVGARGFERELVKAFGVLCERPVKRDPGCAGKLAVIRALDELDWHDEEPFLAGVRLHQPEPSWGPPVDTAGGVRGQSAFALVRLGWPGTPSVLADLLVDPDAPVRANAARAVSAWADPMGAALLRLKLHTGDEDPVVLCEVLAALVELDADSGMALARAWLADRDMERREAAALALGQTRRPEAVHLLVDALRVAVDPEERRMLLVAIGTLRIEPARDALIGLLARRDAEMVLEALAPFRFDPVTLEIALEVAPAELASEVRRALDPDG